MSASGRSDALHRQNLEEVIGGLRKLNASLEVEVEKAANEAVEYKTRIVLVCCAHYFSCETSVHGATL